MLKIEDLMKMFNVSKPTIYRLIEGGELPAIRIGGAWRFRESDIEEYLNKMMRKN